VDVKPKITFVTPYKRVAEMFPPVPAAKALPDWWRKMPLDVTTEDAGKSMTVKRCPGIADHMGQGYVFNLWTDIRIRTFEVDDTLSWDSPWKEYDTLEFFTPQMTAGMPNMEDKHPWVMKFVFPWMVKASPGVSCMFLPLDFAPDPRFTIMPGTFECDVMPAIHGICSWNLREGDETLLSGTPIMQVFPFRRTQFRTDIEVVSMDEWLYLKTTGKNSTTAARLTQGGYRTEVRRKGYPRHAL
jgi:hypothetical protein